MNDYRRAGDEVREAQRTARRIVIDNMPWLVYELTPPSFDRRTAPSLIFESEETMRRVRSYPAGWRDMSDIELFALSWER